MPRNRQLDVNAAKAIYERIKRDTQIFDVKNGSAHTDEEVVALKAALKHFIDYCDRDFKVKQVVMSGKLDIQPGDAHANVAQSAEKIMDDNEVTALFGGPILFKGTNGKWYTVLLESYVAPVSPKFAKAVMEK